MSRELKWNELKYFSKPNTLPKQAKTTPRTIIGQDRAEEALSFGLNIKNKGYNIYISGTAGTGRTTFAQVYAKKFATTEAVPPDLCYVYNFENPKCPKLIKLPAGMGKQLSLEMNELVGRLRAEIPRTFADKGYEQKKNDIFKTQKHRQDEIIKHMSTEARKFDFEAKTNHSGLYFMPIVDGEMINEEQFDALPPEIKEVITKKSEALQPHAAEALRGLREHEKTAKREVEELDYSLGLFAVGHHMDELFNLFGHEPAILEYLKAAKENILENIADFLGGEHDEEEMMPFQPKKSSEDSLTKYKINLLTDNSGLKGAPVVLDFNPTYTNLVGEVEYDNEYGNFSTDFMKIKPGLLHKANGGYLILQAQDVLASLQSWETLRRTLTTGNLLTEPMREYTTGVAVSGIKPEAIPVNIKVILIGSGYYYDVLYTYDEYFEKLFKIRVDFDYEMKLNELNITEITHFAKRYLKDGLTIDDGAICKVIEHAARISERQDRLTTRFNRLGEILTEAAEWAKQDKADKITAKYIDKAIKKREYRLNMYEEKLQELIEEDTIMISSDGSKVGQINGLAVLDMGDFAFAKPARITATAYMGRAGIVNIEKEADMSGSIHDKGIQTLIGYLGQTYAKDFPLSLSCRIGFEQNYSGIDGDSASAAELFAILSALTDLPIRQDIAITGSMNQHGEIQPIGGATYKIEGFFDLCNKRGLTGKQGVIIPARNIRDLVLKDEVIKAVKSGKFHIWAITHVDEGMELLMGLPAGDYPYPNNTIHGKVYRKLRSYNRKGNKV